MLTFQRADAGVIGQYAEKAGQFSDASFYNFEADTETSFYLLPPWKQTRSQILLAREIWEAFLPNKKKWVSFRSWSYLNPDFGAADPIEQYLSELQCLPNVDGDELKRHTPKARFYANVLVAGTKKIPHGQFQAFANAWVPQILNMPSVVWNEICVYMSRIGFEVPYDPNQAILFVVSKTGRNLNTEYKVEFSGSRGPTGEVAPNRYNLVQHLGVEKVQAIIDSATDLDRRWSPPDVNNPSFIQAREDAKRALKAKFAGTGIVGGVPGVSPSPYGGGSVIGGGGVPAIQPSPMAPPPVAPTAPFIAPPAPPAPYTAPTASPPPGYNPSYTGNPPPAPFPATTAPVAPLAPTFIQSAPPVSSVPPSAPAFAPIASPTGVPGFPVPPGLQVPDVPVPPVPSIPPVRL